MSATSLQIITVAFPNPSWSPTSTNAFNRINSTLSFFDLIPFRLTTLSSTGANPGSAITGLIYTPDLPPDDPCRDAAAPYVPHNATRQKNLPETDYDLVAIAPWLSPHCVKAYLDSAADDPVRAFLFFLPDNASSTPPEAGSNQWSLGDGDNWKNQERYPVYAIPGQNGQQLMSASAQYSGNMTEVPHGHQLTESYDPRDYVRLFALVDTDGGSALPSLWVFLLVVLGILLSVIGFTSLAMHIVQRRRREGLRRRVARGEVDLEALGIKRLTVPQAMLNKMPLYTYGTGAPVVTQPARTAVREAHAASTSASKLEEGGDSRPSSPLSTTLPAPAITRTSSYRPTPLSQPTCAICLDDYVPPSAGTEGTIVRELPCHHIFHPECVDTFLRDSSSLCPMCKKTVLPQGYCPRIVTNAMVRRERMIRRLRPTVGADDEMAVREELGLRRGTSVANSRSVAGRRVLSMPVSSSEMTEMGGTAAISRSNTTVSGQRNITAPTPSTQAVQPSTNPSRREWARQRAVAMLGRNPAPIDPDAEEAQRTPGWRKALRGLFPGVGR